MGADSFSYRVSDGIANSPAVIVTLNVLLAPAFSAALTSPASTRPFASNSDILQNAGQAIAAATSVPDVAQIAIDGPPPFELALRRVFTT